MLKKVLTFFSDNKFIIVIFALSLFLRAWSLDSFPIGITHDELNYVLSAKSLFLTGQFLPQTAPAIFSANMNSFTVVIAEVPALIIALVAGGLNLSLFNSRFLGIILSSLNVVLIYFIVLRLLRNKYVARCSSFLAVINPWSFLMGRSAFEVNYYIFFFLLALLILLKNNGYRILLSLPIYLLGFLSYTGGQIVFYFYSIVILVFHYLNQKRAGVSLKPYLIYFAISTLFLTIYIFKIVSGQSFQSRGEELLLPNSKEISQIVDKERLLSVPSKLNTVFINKLTVYTKSFLEKYFDAFSTNILFLNGEFRASFSLQKHGTFYLIDFIFLILGICFLFIKNKKVWILFLTIILIAPLTSGLSTVEHSFSQRAGLMYPFLIILCGCGVVYLLDFLKENLKFIFLVVIISIYLLSFLNLLHTYFYRFPVYSSSGWFYQDRLLSNYLVRLSRSFPDKKMIISSSEPKITFEEFLFFSNSYKDKESARVINEKLNRSDFSLGNIRFIDECFKSNVVDKDTVWIYDSLLNCKALDMIPVRITRFEDVYAKYVINNDPLCKNFSLGQYIEPMSFRNFNIERESNQNFCRKWITRI